MPPTLTQAASFGDQLKLLRRRARMTQRDLGLAVGYTEGYICRLERNQRQPDLLTLTALFVPALGLEREPEQVTRLLELARQARGGVEPAEAAQSTATQVTTTTSTAELGVLEDIPTAPRHAVERPGALARLSTAFQQTNAVSLVGLAGMGKTTLAAALARSAAATQPVLWLTMGHQHTDLSAVLLRQLALFALATFGAEGVLPLLQAVPGVAPLPPARQVALVQEALTEAGPLLVCVDEAHRLAGDEAALGVVRDLLGTGRWLFVGREAVPVAGTVEVPLGGLEAAEEQALLAQLGGQLPATLAEPLLRKTGGSPFLLRLAVGQMLASGTPAQVFVAHLETLPAVADYLLENFLGQLSPGAARLADLVAIFRQPINIYDELLVELGQAADGPYDVVAAASELQRRQLIEHAAHAALHPLIKDHLYAALVGDLARRRKLHRTAAEWHELGPGDWVEAAYHYAHAGQLARAVEVLTDRGGELFSRGEAVEAAAVVDLILKRARERRASTPDLRRRLLTVRGDLLVFGLRAAEAETNYREALALAGPPGVRATLVWRLAQSLIQRGQTAEALELCRAAAADLAPGDELLRAQLSAAEGWALLQLARYAEAEEAALRAIALAEPLAGLAPRAVDEVRARAHHLAGVTHNIRGQPDVAFEHWQRTVEAAERAGLRQVAYRTRMNLGLMLFQHHDDLPGALRNFQQSLEQARPLGDTYLIGRILVNIGYIQHVQCDLAGAERTLAEAVEVRRQMGDLPGVANTENLRALVLLFQGQVEAARERIERVRRETETLTDMRMRGAFVVTLTMIQLVAGEAQQTRALLQATLDSPGMQEDVKVRSDLHSLLALALVADGDVPAASAVLAEVAPAAGGADVKFERELLVGLIALATGDGAAARARAASVAERAAALGYEMQALGGRRLLAAVDAPPPLSEFPRLLWGAVERGA